MKNVKLYYIPIGYMIVYTIAILGTGVWLFLLSQGLANFGLMQTLKEIIAQPEPKSFYGFVEVATPHMFAIGTLIFVVAHFLLFSTKISQIFSLRVSILLFILAFLNIGAYLAIIFGLIVSGWIKLFSITLFVLLFLFMLSMVAFSL